MESPDVHFATSPGFDSVALDGFEVRKHESFNFKIPSQKKKIWGGRLQIPMKYDICAKRLCGGLARDLVEFLAFFGCNCHDHNLVCSA